MSYDLLLDYFRAAVCGKFAALVMSELAQIFHVNLRSSTRFFFLEKYVVEL